MDKKNKLIIGLVAACCLLGGILVGVLVGRPSTKVVSEPKEQVAPVEEITEEPVVEEVAVEKKTEEKTYGFYPSFYVKRTYYSVSAAEANHPLAVYGGKVAKAWTDCRWLEEEKLERGGTHFHVKENKDRETRKGHLFIQDESGRKITISVSQRGK